MKYLRGQKDASREQKNSWPFRTSTTQQSDFLVEIQVEFFYLSRFRARMEVNASHSISESDFLSVSETCNA